MGVNLFFLKRAGWSTPSRKPPDFRPVSIFIIDNTKLQNLFDLAKYLLLKCIKMYYLKIIKKPGVKGPDGKYRFKSSRIPIDKKTFDLLYNSMFMWWSPGLSKDIGNSGVENVIQDKLSDVFYLITNQIIEDKLGMTYKDFDYEDVDSTENEIEVNIEVII